MWSWNENGLFTSSEFYSLICNITLLTIIEDVAFVKITLSRVFLIINQDTIRIILTWTGVGSAKRDWSFSTKAESTLNFDSNLYQASIGSGMSLPKTWILQLETFKIYLFNKVKRDIRITRDIIWRKTKCHEIYYCFELWM